MRLIIFTFAILNYGNSLKILLYNSGFGHSHMRFMGSIADILLEAGHHVTEIRTTMDPGLKWEGISNSKDIHVYGPDAEVEALMMLVNMTQMLVRSCEHAVFETDLLEKLKTQDFDLGITEALDPCGLAIFHLLNLKTWVSASSSNLLEHQAVLLGVPLVPSYVPGPMGASSDRMTLFDRALNAVSMYFGSKVFVDIFAASTENFRKHLGKDFVDISSLIPKSALFFTNSQSLIDFPKPTLHKVIDVGGIHLKEGDAEKLDANWEKILKNRPKTVLISFGSAVKSWRMPESFKKAIIQAVKEIPDVQFIWKYEKDDLTAWGLPENLHLSKWTPQNALLADPRLSLFITHGGLGSTTEIAYSGTPAIVIPLFADQHRNAQVLLRHGATEKMNRFDLSSSEKIKATIRKFLDDPSYDRKAKDLATMLKNAPFKPKELLLRNIEFVGRYGALPQLDPYGRHLSFVEYYLLDIIGILRFLVPTMIQEAL
ncbi:unnamed protein product, partial [Mesorhabditis spiculigera]